jgi:hypothetical protein
LKNYTEKEKILDPMAITAKAAREETIAIATHALTKTEEATIHIEEEINEFF